MNKQTTTNNIKALNKDVEIIKKHFSHCFDKNGNFDLEKFKSELSKNEIDFSNESYGMDWLGKSYARLLASDEATTLLKEDKKWNDQPQNTNSQNLLIKGDNLEVLKHLSSAYYEKVKMIYIDPPYNTGSDGFVYQDDRKFTVDEFRKLAGVDEEKAKRILDFVDSKSNSHSAWLTFMYPRLYIAKQLLSDDGVIFVSIDDNEVAQLRILMDEIFGEENFVGQITLVNNPRGRDYGGVAQLHEYILVYKMSSNAIVNSLDDPDKRFPFEDELSGFELRELRNRNIAFNKENRPNLYYPFYINTNKNIDNDLFEISLEKKVGYFELFPKESQGYNTVWRWGKEKSNENLNVNIAGKKMNDGGFQIVEKYRKTEKMARSVWWDKEDNSEKGTLHLKELFQGKKVFNFPKSVDVIKKLIKMGMDNDGIALDFFAGSGTTGDAVMQLNADDGGNRKYILVQLAEEIDNKKDKVAYDFVKNELGVEKPTIFDITKERLIRAGMKIQKDNKDLSNLDFGFKVFETIPIWEGYDLDAESFDSQMELFNENKLSDEDLQTLLTTWKTYDGVPLTQNVVAIDLDGYTAHYLDTRVYLMNKGFGTKNLKKLLDEIDVNNDFNPRTVIAFGYNFESKMLRELEENIKNYANKKEIEIDFITRY